MEELNMSTMKNLQIAAMAAAVAGALFAPFGARAQNGVTRTDLQRHDLSAPGREGTLEYQVEDKPPVTLKAGDVLFIPAGTVHSARNFGSVTGSELATYIVEKGKPLLTLVK